MLPKKHRLLTERDFQTAWKRGRSFYTKNIGFKILENRLGVSRFGIVVSNKVSNKSTERNLLKRRLREIVQTKIEVISPGYDLIITALPPALCQTFRSLEKEITDGLKHFKVIKI